ncbi:MAG: hypothetical protein EAX95_15510, partial [Candidatus Thorarchaeota archaeon]|nr:hypothetical protein [Candidatus Thorarchaeota archaeon]
MSRGTGAILLLLLIAIPLAFATMGERNSVTSTVQTDLSSSMGELTPHEPIVITNNTDFTLQGWPGDGNTTSPYVISGLLLSPSPGTYALNISGTVTANYVVINCSVNGGGDADGFYLGAGQATVTECNFTEVSIGIALTGLENATVQMCNMNVTGSQSALQVENCNNTVIEMCNIWNAGVAVTTSPLTQMTACFIYDSESTAISISESDDCTLSGLIVIGGDGDGIVVDRCDFAFAIGNTVTNATGTGFSVVDSTGGYFYSIQSIGNNVGVLIDSVNESAFMSLLTHHCSDSGVLLIATNETEISSSCSYANGAHGIEIAGGSYNTLVGNYLGFNVLSAALDNGVNNAWDDGGVLGRGNYWGSYDGVGDQEVPGSGGGIDHYPHLWVFPEITPTWRERFIESGNNDELVACYFQGTKPFMCMVTINGVMVSFEILDESADRKFVFIGSRPVGVYNYSIFITYECGIVLESRTMVTILPQEGPRINAYEIISGDPAAGSPITIRLEVTDRTSIRHVALTYYVNGVLTYDVNVTAVYDHGIWENDLTTQWCDVTLPELLSEGDFVEFQAFARDDFNMWGSSEVWNFTVGP